ncbi:MAG: phosphatidylinositol transfer protein [Chitinophagaceae bacterium]|nr:phosphatidylinositol transfer protein [Oligoflexus sp.]
MRTRVMAMATLLTILSFACRNMSKKVIKEQVSSEQALTIPRHLPPSCPLPKTCTEDQPVFPEPLGFKSLRNMAIAKIGAYSHRGRDIIALPGKPLWIIGKFTYSYIDANLTDEPVDIYISEGCSKGWQKIAQTKTTHSKEHETVENVADDGGRIFVELTSLGVNLPIGRHKILLVVPADNSYAEMYVDVVDPGTPFVITDVDGTLTSSEWAAATEAWAQIPEAHPNAAETFQQFYNKGYHIIYMTARADWFIYRTRLWLNKKGFPPGTLRTTSSQLGFNGIAASLFKTSELALLKTNTGIIPSFAFGNKPSDVEAYGKAGISPTSSYYFGLTDTDPLGGTIHSDYGALTKTFSSLPSICTP